MLVFYTNRTFPIVQEKSSLIKGFFFFNIGIHVEANLNPEDKVSLFGPRIVSVSSKRIDPVDKALLFGLNE